jgi:hypothetical protein
LAARFQRPRDIHRKGFGIEFFLGLGFDANVSHVGTLSPHFGFVIARSKERSRN